MSNDLTAIQVSIYDHDLVQKAWNHFCNEEWAQVGTVYVDPEVKNLPEDQLIKIREIWIAAILKGDNDLEVNSAQSSLRRPFDGRDSNSRPTKRARPDSQSRWGVFSSGFGNIFPRILEKLPLQEVGRSFRVCKLWSECQDAYWQRLAEKKIPKQKLQEIIRDIQDIGEEALNVHSVSIDPPVSDVLTILKEVSIEKLRPEEWYHEFIDEQFMIFANKVAEQLPSVSFADVKEARKWMADPENQQARQGIKSLNLEGMHLVILPPEIGQLMGLEELNVGYNRLASLPAELGQLQKLTKLNCEDNCFKSLPAEIGQLTNLTELDFSGSLLTSLPAEIGQLTNLKELNVENNQLTSLPAELGQLTNLKELNVSDNQLASLPTELGQLTNLEGLYVSSNELTSLPTELGQLTNLEGLHVSNNELTSLPAELGQLTNLERLYVSNNELTSLPVELGQLTNLEWLYVFNNNQLTTLPREIRYLQGLSISIHGTQINFL